MGYRHDEKSKNIREKYSARMDKRLLHFVESFSNTSQFHPIDPKPGSRFDRMKDHHHQCTLDEKRNRGSTYLRKATLNSPGAVRKMHCGR